MWTLSKVIKKQTTSLAFVSGQTVYEFENEKAVEFVRFVTFLRIPTHYGKE